MSLQGIDVSNWKDVDVSKARDFVIVQTTWGIGQFNNTNLVNGVSTIADKQYQTARAAGKLRAFMHYYAGGDVNTEADFFIQHNQGYLGDGIPMIDWEQADNPQFGNPGTFDALLAAFESKIGGPGIVYFQQSEYDTLKPIADKHNWGSFVAQYASMDSTGVQDTPWNEGAYGCAIRQYTSNGDIGAGSPLDLDKFYGDATAWNAYVKASIGGSSTPAPSPSPVQPLADTLEGMASDVQTGRYGNGDERVAKLGRYATAVQAIVNERAGVITGDQSHDVLANEVIAGTLGNGDERVRLLGSYATAVQDLVNHKLGSSSAPSNVEHYTVRNGDTISGIAAAYGVSISQVSGFRSGNPDLIYAGETLTITH